MQKVFISSTSIDLQEYREAVDRTLRQLGFATIKMEDFSAMGSGAVEACLAKVDEADIYIGIFAYRYGFIPEGTNISITEIEYNRARGNGITCLCFFVDEDIPWPPKHIEYGAAYEKLADLKARISSSVIRTTFTSPTDLALQVTKALYNLKSEGEDPYVQVLQNNRDADYRVLEYLQRHRVQHARMILHNGMSMRDAVEVIIDNGGEVDMLVQHPDACVSASTRERVEVSLNIYARSLQKGLGDRVRLWLYHDIAAYRGILLESDFLLVSWYTYYTRPDHTIKMESRPHCRFLLTGQNDSFYTALSTFDSVFNELMSNAQPFADYLINT